MSTYIPRYVIVTAFMDPRDAIDYAKSRADEYTQALVYILGRGMFTSFGPDFRLSSDAISAAVTEVLGTED